jgi:hypothetical protein
MVKIDSAKIRPTYTGVKWKIIILGKTELNRTQTDETQERSNVQKATLKRLRNVS